MKKILFLAALSCSTATFAQTGTYSAMQVVNRDPKERAAVYAAHPEPDGSEVTVIDGDAKIKVKFLSCTASRSTQQALFTFMVMNSAELTNLEIISGPGQSLAGFHGEQGQDYPSDYATSGTGPLANHSVMVATNIPFECTIPLRELPLSVTRLTRVALAFSKRSPSASKRADFQRKLAVRRLGKVKPGTVIGERTSFQTTLENMPVTWIP